MSATLLRLPTTIPEWHALAQCRCHAELDWIEATPGDAEAERCKCICRRCPVRLACLATAMENQEPWGVWGGLDADQRADLAEQSNTPVPRTLPSHGRGARYAKHGCRCQLCREAHRAYVRHRRSRSTSHRAADDRAPQAWKGTTA